MMDWMHQYKNPRSLSPENAAIYLQSQLSRIEQVQKLIENALLNARKINYRYENTRHQ